MVVKILGYSLLICLAICVGLALFPGDALAQGQDDVAKGADKSFAAKKGVGQSLGNKDIDQSKLPGNKEMALTVAATIAMIAVVKWL